MNSFNQIEMKVMGEDVRVNLDDELEIGDVSSDMNAIAAQISFWGAVWASAEKEAIKSEAYYRAWRARTGERISNADSKKPEWKVRQEIEASSEFVKLKDAIAQATHNATLAKTTCEAFKSKASMLQSKGAMMRAELDTTGMKVPSSRGNKDDSNMADKKEAMRSALKKK
jgi:hypothetical protein